MQRPHAYVFSPKEVWDGLQLDDGTWLCNGLIRDWAGWQKENGRPFETLAEVLKVLSPGESEEMRPGKLTRISLNDVRDMPTLVMPYGQEVAVVHASSGMRRIISLAYFGLVLGRASVEPLFDESQDAWWDIDLVNDALADTPAVRFNRRPFVRHGDVSRWLVSEAFDLSSARSLEAERTLELAAKVLASEDVNADTAKALKRIGTSKNFGDRPFTAAAEGYKASAFLAREPGRLAPSLRWNLFLPVHFPGARKRQCKRDYSHLLDPFHVTSGMFSIEFATGRNERNRPQAADSPHLT